jgi:hypothetical protein
MQKYKSVLAIILLPCLLTSLIFLAQSAYRAFVVANCYPQFSCKDGFIFDLAVAGVAFLLSSIGAIIGGLAHLNTIRSFQSFQIFKLVTILTLVLTLFRYSVRYWPHPPPVITSSLWIAGTGSIFIIVILAFRWFASNYAIKRDRRENSTFK